VKLVSVAEMRAAEAAAFAAGISEATLQARAGAAVAAHAGQLAPQGWVTVLAGIGNNGRDGWVAACELARRGRQVRLYLAPGHAVQESELQELRGLGGIVALQAADPSLSLLDAWLQDAALVVDGLLGIGGRGAPRPPLNEIIARLNRAADERRPALQVLSIDTPTGVDADSGEVPTEAVRADATVVLGGLKRGLVRFPAANFTGVLLVGDIGLPPSALALQQVETLSRAEIRRLVPSRDPGGHKGTFGRVVVAAGSPHYFGAPYLAGAAAARAGAGLVGFAVEPGLQSVLAGLLPEATYVRLPAGAPDDGASDAARAVVAAATGANALVLGPGLGRSAGAMQFVLDVLEGRREQSPETPVVVDADGLYALGAVRVDRPVLGRNVILTPHHGEMARLTGLPSTTIADEPWEVARQVAREWEAVVVLKGPFTVVASTDGAARLLPHANPALGTGGTGDVLAGLIAGLLAQGVEPYAAGCAGVYVHAGAAQRALTRMRTDLLLAADLLAEIGPELAALRSERGDRLALNQVSWAERM
jgi:NAD(P)H-hydrate epimerase